MYPNTLDWFKNTGFKGRFKDYNEANQMGMGMIGKRKEHSVCFFVSLLHLNTCF